MSKALPVLNMVFRNVMTYMSTVLITWNGNLAMWIFVSFCELRWMMDSRTCPFCTTYIINVNPWNPTLALSLGSMKSDVLWDAQIPLFRDCSSVFYQFNPSNSTALNLHSTFLEFCGLNLMMDRRVAPLVSKKMGYD